MHIFETHLVPIKSINFQVYDISISVFLTYLKVYSFKMYYYVMLKNIYFIVLK